MWSVLWRLKEFYSRDALPSCNWKVVVTFKFLSTEVWGTVTKLCVVLKRKAVLSVYTWDSSKLTLPIQILPGRIASPMIFFTTKAWKREILATSVRNRQKQLYSWNSLFWNCKHACSFLRVFFYWNSRNMAYSPGLHLLSSFCLGFIVGNSICLLLSVRFIRPVLSQFYLNLCT